MWVYGWHKFCWGSTVSFSDAMRRDEYVRKEGAL
jgi:hypothetical protein